MSVCLPEVGQLKKEMETIQDVREELIVVQNRTTENVRILAQDVDDFSEIKFELEERIEVIEKANLVEEKPEQEYIPEDSYPYEEIKFETEEEIEKFISETNEKHIEIKMEIPSAPEEEYEDREEDEIAENLEEEEYLDDKEAFEDEENLEHQSYENVNEDNRKMLEGWYARCEKVGLIPKEFTLLPENKSAIEDQEIEVEINQEVEETNEIPETKKNPKTKMTLK